MTTRDGDTERSTSVPDQGDVQERPGLPPRAPGTGRFTQTQEAAERHAEAARLRAAGWTFQAISDHLGYGGRGNVQRALAQLRAEVIVPAVDEMRDAEDAKLDKLERACLQVLETRHLRFHEGSALTHEGKPVVDDEVVLKATTTLLRIADRRARLWGLDAPVKTEVGGAVHVRYVVDGVDMGKV